MDFRPLEPELSALLAQQHLQRPLADLVVADVEAVVTQAHLEPGDVLIRQDEPATALYLILRGRVVTEGVLLYSRDEEGRVAFEVASRNEYFDFLPAYRAYQQMSLARMAGGADRG